MPTSASRAGLAEPGDQVVVGAGVVVEGDEVAVGGELQMYSIPQLGHHPRQLQQLVVVVKRRGIQRDLHDGHAPVNRVARATISTATGLTLSPEDSDAGGTDCGGGVAVPRSRPVDVDAAAYRVHPPLESRCRRPGRSVRLKPGVIWPPQVPAAVLRTMPDVQPDHRAAATRRPPRCGPRRRRRSSRTTLRRRGLPEAVRRRWRSAGRADAFWRIRDWRRA